MQNLQLLDFNHAIYFSKTVIYRYEIIFITQTALNMSKIAIFIALEIS